MRAPPYDRLIDAETWAFIDRSTAFYPPDAASLDLADQRRVYDDLCRAFSSPRPDGVVTRDFAIPGAFAPIPAREYRHPDHAPKAQVLYLHGGGFILGGLESHGSICAEICDATGYQVISVDYRLAPEHPHPAQFEDALAAFRDTAGASDLPVVLCGDSAGGNLAAAIAWATRGSNHLPVGQVLIYPALGADTDRGSFVTHAHAPMLTTADMIYYDAARSGGHPPASDPRFTPLAATEFDTMPPTVIFTAECDPLSGDAPDYCARIVRAGGKAMVVEEKGLVHGYLRARHSVSRARASFARMISAISSLGAGHWPYPGD